MPPLTSIAGGIVSTLVPQPLSDTTLYFYQAATGQKFFHVVSTNKDAFAY